MFYYLAMLWMGIWIRVPTYTDMLVLVGLNFRKLGVQIRLSDVLWSWLRLQIYTDWVHPCTVVLGCKMGRIFRKLGVFLSPSNVVGSWGGYNQTQMASNIHIIYEQNGFLPC